MSIGFIASSRLLSNRPTRTEPGRGAGLKTLFAALIFALAASLTFVTTADARIGGGGSFGSRGSRTFSMPSATPTAPRISPFQRSATPNGGYTNPGFGNAGFAGRPGFFGGGFGRGLLGGFLGAGVFGMLFGGGFAGGLGGGLSLIGLILQLGLLFLVVRFAMRWFANRQQPAFGAGAAPIGSGFGSAMGGGASGQAGADSAPIGIGPDDYQAFERRLTESQTTYSDGDIGTLHRIATPEMAGEFEQELRNNDQHGVVNRISDVRLLQGDLSEAWRESGSDYATVAMKFSLIDQTIEKNSGRIVAGDAHVAQQVTEVWTFRRPSGGGAQAWALSGIQQA